MAQVGSAIRRQNELLKGQVEKTILEWNPGNHFVDSVNIGDYTTSLPKGERASFASFYLLDIIMMHKVLAKASGRAERHGLC